MNQVWSVAGHLADGAVHSGEELGAKLHITRAAVWKNIQQLILLNVPIQTVRGQGYCIPGGLELLNAEAIQQQLSALGVAFPYQLDIFPGIPSTQNYLLDALKKSTPMTMPWICLAEHQHAGRGRHERRWVSAFGRNIYLSLAWQFDAFPRDFSALSLMVAVVTTRVLKQLGVGPLGVKWPNDLVSNDKKLGGILIEVQGQSEGPTTVVIGIGINGELPTTATDHIEQPWTDIKQVTGKALPRNQTVAALIAQLTQAIPVFKQAGLQPFLAEWQQFDALIHREICVHTIAEKQPGIACGIDASGALMVDKGGEISRYRSGEVRVRLR
jgi:BirA family transcriptional regulator, biotin operon repressor / biotin---[acetyl-CoA-carboxylase] ligase